MLKLKHQVLPYLTDKDRDFVLLIDGNEGIGKSTLAGQLGAYIDPTLNLDRICFTPDEFKKAIYGATKGQCVIYDEAFTGLSSRAALSKINKILISLMMQMRQKNLFVIIVLPTIFMLDRYVALFRTSSLIHCYESNGRRGFFRVYNKKKKNQLYIRGKKFYDYRCVKTNFNGRFYGKFALGPAIEVQYRKKKMDALEGRKNDPQVEKNISERDLQIRSAKIFCKKFKLPFKEYIQLLQSKGCELDDKTIYRIAGEKDDNVC